jgi:Fe-S oxidoreductase
MKQLVFVAIAAAALGGFVWTMQRYIGVMMLGRADWRPRFDQLLERLRFLLVFFVGQKKVAEHQVKPSPSSWHHLIIFWGFLVIQLGTLELMIQGLTNGGSLASILPPIVHTPLRVVIDLMSLAVLAMIAYGFYRRVVVRPRLIPMNLDAGLILGGIAGLMITYFMFESFRAVALGEPEVHAAPISSALLTLGRAVGPDAAFALSEAGWWGHVLLVFAFLNYLPYSKHIHLLGALPNIVTANLSPRKLDIPKMNLEDESEWGVGKFEQFTWKQLLDTYACTECARCSNYCPANATDKPLSPMQLIHDIRYEMLETGKLKREVDELRAEYEQADGLTQPSLRPVLDAAVARLEAQPPMVGGRIKDETLWSCTMCGACQESCPVFIEHPLKILQMRQNLVLAQERVPSDLARAFRNIERNQNPWGIGADQRMDWAEGLDVPTIDDKPNPEYLLWVGCAGAFDQRIRKQTQAMVKILNAAKVDYAVLGHQESCTGDPARRGGNEMLFQMQAEANVETLNSAGVKKVITSCPHCLHTLRHDYPQFGGTYEVIHHTQLLAHLMERGKVPQNGAALGKVVYHDSCYLGRWNGEFDAPRDVIRRLPVVGMVEPERARAKGFCCGAGGGRMFMEEKIGGRVNRNRAEELVATGADTIAVACPFCNVMMTDGMKDMNKEESVKVLDVAELVAATLPSTQDASENPPPDVIG